MISIYNNFAYIYDKMMEDYDYDSWLQYIDDILTQKEIVPNTLVDLACGTGSFTIGFKQVGYDVIGVDNSADMLSVAKNKAIELDMDITFICQDIRELRLHRPVDVITCMCDGFNYLLSDYDLKSALSKTYNYLNKDGALIFDISSYYKLENVLGDNLMADTSDDISLIWFNDFDKENETCHMDLTFFVRDGNGYVRFDETHCQRAYKLENVLDMLKEVGFVNIEVYDPFSFERPKRDSHRWVFIAEKS